MSTLIDFPPSPATDALPAVSIEARGVSRVLHGGVRTLDAISFRIEPARLVGIIGASGAGKTTLLETLAGLRAPTSGQVLLGGCDPHRDRAEMRRVVGFVPQDDIIHRDLPVRLTLRYAARLRLPGADAAVLDERVDRTLEALGLSTQSRTVVGRLSGGQRKRVSIAVELLSQPRALFLDEPTSGLDPGTAHALIDELQELAAGGSTVVLTTHSPDDVARCDEVLVLASGGRLVFKGSPAGALAHFGVREIASIYRLLDDDHDPAVRGDDRAIHGDDRAIHGDDRPAPVEPVAPSAAGIDAGPTGTTAAARWRQWSVLCRRNVDVLARSRLTLAIMLGAPVLVVAMFVVLFRPGGFDRQAGDPLAAVGVTYWLAFSAFFFGLTYGLLQVCTEMAVLRRERHVGLGLGAYLMAKVTVLLPALLVVNLLMVAVLQVAGRLPGGGMRTTAGLVAVMTLEAAAALALGLLASAAVSDPTQATLALPMICFPAVLFGGAVLPVQAMATAGRLISLVTPARWAFEALGGVLALAQRFQAPGLGGVVVQHHGSAFSGALAGPVVVLTLFTVVALVAAVRVLAHRTAVR